MANSRPFEIIAQPFDVYIAPVATAFPKPWEAPADPWRLIGSSGARNYAPDGVTVQHSQAVNTFRSLGGPGPRKTFRTEEDLKIRFMLADLSLEEYALALNSNSVTTTPEAGGDPQSQKVGLSRGIDIETIAVLVRGEHASPKGDFPAQYEIPLAQNTGSPEVVHRRDQPALLAIEFTALEDPDAASDDERFGRLVIQSFDSPT